jgi:hypothetical protein
MSGLRSIQSGSCPSSWVSRSGLKRKSKVGDDREVGLGEQLIAAGVRLRVADRRLFTDAGADRPLRVEERAVPAAGQDTVQEAFAALPERAQVEGGAPGHLLGVEGGDRLIVFGDVGRPPVANPLEQPGQARVDRSVLAEDEPHPVPARLALAALTRPALSLSHGLLEAFRA